MMHERTDLTQFLRFKKMGEETVAFQHVGLARQLVSLQSWVFEDADIQQMGYKRRVIEINN